MSSININKDKFLQRQGIQVQGSDFFKKSLIQKEKGIKQQYNLRDIHGMRLSRYWEPGDTFWTVVRKKMYSRVEGVLNPDTYTEENLKQAKQFMVREKIKIGGILITLMLPFTIYYNFVRPKVNRIKRLYLMQFYNKMNFFSKQLGIKTKQVSKKNLQDSL